MYSEQDLRDAVAGGAITSESADALRAYVANARQVPLGDEENFRLINGFNDIFVAIGVVIMLVAMGAIGQAIAGAVAGGFYPDMVGLSFWDLEGEMAEEFAVYSNLRDGLSVALGGALVAATAWPLAEFFTRKRRMALPSIILLLAFVGGIFACAVGFGIAAVVNGNDRLAPLVIAGGALLSAGGAWLHWKRFMVPITVAAGAAAIAGTLVALIAAAIGPNRENMETIMLSLVFVAGLAVFAFAMRWDMSDPSRSTRRSDVAFWLHLLAAPMIAHPVFHLLGVTENEALGVGAALGVLAVYVVFGLVALTIDRRALLVSALAYVLIALTFLFDRFGAVELTFALTALVIGSALLTLSAFWSTIRKAVVEKLPEDLAAHLPATSVVAVSA
ncbi:hypothetical protein [Erythrobacter sp. EC-HK427]|uniref:hypothetical protein n=1 Tax=Erythrobacter sp. EC-HK427 TaxID=2038396 RepID=UPI00125C3365|nr:hypothetical protein [Erythrobacter sp. EC-HK427]VVT20285.1 conserved membrane hypothetical protein [Erythrobacter sp. EC-HK427]